MTDFYKELGDFLNPQMSQQEILTELKKQKAIWHRREITGGDQAKAKSLLINQALEVFATEESRKKYDKELEESKREEPQSQVEKVDYEKEREENLDKVESAISNMKIWSGSYSSLGRNEFTKAKAEGEKFMDRANTNLKMIIIASDSIKKLSANTKNEFNGWKVTHKFRAKTKGGNSTIGNYIYIMDKDMKNIIYQEDTEDKDIINAKKYIKEAISK